MLHTVVCVHKHMLLFVSQYTHGSSVDNASFPGKWFMVREDVKSVRRPGDRHRNTIAWKTDRVSALYSLLFSSWQKELRTSDLCPDWHSAFEADSDSPESASNYWRFMTHMCFRDQKPGCRAYGNCAVAAGAGTCPHQLQRKTISTPTNAFNEATEVSRGSLAVMRHHWPQHRSSSGQCWVRQLQHRRRSIPPQRRHNIRQNCRLGNLPLRYFQRLDKNCCFYLHQAGSPVSVCLFVNRITQKYWPNPGLNRLDFEWTWPKVKVVRRQKVKIVL